MTRNPPSSVEPTAATAAAPAPTSASSKATAPAAPAPSPLQQELDKHAKGGGGWWQWVVVVLLVGAAVWYFYGGGSGTHGGAAAAGKATETEAGGARRNNSGGRRGPMVIPVVTEQVRAGAIDVVVEGLGTVTPLATVTVKSRVDGELTKVHYTEGQMVKEGDLLAQIDSRPFDVALAQAEGQLMRDQALLKNARVDLERYQGLAKKEAIPMQTLTSQESLVAQYEGTVKTNQAVVDNARLNITYCNITSPLTGRVGLRLVDQGNMVRANDTTGLVVITQIQPITVVFPIAADKVPAVLARVHAGLTLRVEAWDSMLQNKLADGKLLTVDNAVDTTSGTLKCKALFDNKDLTLYPNQFVNVQLIVESRSDVTLIPPAAIQRGAEAPFVFILKPDNTVTMRTIQTGISTPTTVKTAAVEVLSGLKPGELVVTAGVDKLQEGSKVTLGGPKAADSAAPGTGPQPPHGQKADATRADGGAVPLPDGAEPSLAPPAPVTASPAPGSAPASAPGESRRRNRERSAASTNSPSASPSPSSAAAPSSAPTSAPNPPAR